MLTYGKRSFWAHGQNTGPVLTQFGHYFSLTFKSDTLPGGNKETTI